jgi:SAM-dependent methyltransferase
MTAGHRARGWPACLRAWPPPWPGAGRLRVTGLPCGEQCVNWAWRAGDGRWQRQRVEVQVGGHFERVAAVYESLRTTDEAPVRTISQLLPPVTALDIGCGTGRYTRLLRAVLPDGSRLAASDVSAAMLAQLKAASQRHGDEVAPLLAAAEELPLRAASLDLVTAFNCVHHFDLGRFLAAAARVLAPGGQLFIYTRTSQQNARTIWGRYFPGFTEHERRLQQRGRAPGRRQAGRRAHGGRHTDLPPPAHQHRRAAPGPGRGMPLLDLLFLPAAGAACSHRCLPGLPAPPRSVLD